MKLGARPRHRWAGSHEGACRRSSEALGRHGGSLDGQAWTASDLQRPLATHTRTASYVLTSSRLMGPQCLVRPSVRGGRL